MPRKRYKAGDPYTYLSLEEGLLIKTVEGWIDKLVPGGRQRMLLKVGLGHRVDDLVHFLALAQSSTNEQTGYLCTRIAHAAHKEGKLSLHMLANLDVFTGNVNQSIRCEGPYAGINSQDMIDIRGADISTLDKNDIKILLGEGSHRIGEVNVCKFLILRGIKEQTKSFRAFLQSPDQGFKAAKEEVAAEVLQKADYLARNDELFLERLRLLVKRHEDLRS